MRKDDWISVEDRLPKMEGGNMDIVLCCNEYGHLFEGSYDEEDEQWVSIFDFEGNVRWWRPIILPNNEHFI